MRGGAASLSDGTVYVLGDHNNWEGTERVQVIRPCSAEEGPDASINSSDISYSPSNPLPGDTVEISARVHNIGTIDITSGNIHFFFSIHPNDPLNLIASESFDDIPAGEYTDITIDWHTDEDMDPMIYTITAMLTDILPYDINPHNNEAYIELALPVELAYFTAVGINNRANIRWKTLSETDNLGFNLYRLNISNVNPYISFLPAKLNESLIPGQGTASGPHSYSFIDHGINRFFDYIYILESVSTYGETEEYRAPLMRISPREIIL